MKKFQFKLKALLHLRETRRNSCRQLLARLIADERKLKEEKTGILQEKEDYLKDLKKIGDAGMVDVNQISSHRYYVNQLSGNVLLVDQKIETLNHQISLCRKALVKADQEVKVLVKLKEKQQLQFLEDESRIEAREQEEAWLASHLSGGTK